MTSIIVADGNFASCQLKQTFKCRQKMHCQQCDPRDRPYHTNQGLFASSKHFMAHIFASTSSTHFASLSHVPLSANFKGVKIMTKICNHVMREGVMPREWELSTLIPIYKGKGDPMECDSYRGISSWNME